MNKETLAKLMADRIGHGMAEKCDVHAEVAMEVIETHRLESLREQFAAAALTGLCMAYKTEHPNRLALWAWQQADEMLATQNVKAQE